MRTLNRLLLSSGLLLIAGGTLRSAQESVKVAVSAAVSREAAEGERGTYALAIAGFDQIGPLAPLDAPIPTTQLAAVVDEALQAGAVGTKVGLEASPALVIVCHWGEVHPNGGNLKVRRPTGSPRPLMDALLRGLDNRALPRIDRNDYEAAAGRERFFLMVTAYDGHALRDGEVVRLWQTRASADSMDANSVAVWQVLAQASAPHFGQALERIRFVRQDVPAAAAARLPEFAVVAAAEHVLPARDLAIERAIL